MPIDTLLKASPHPAREAAIQSITAVQNNDRAAWLALWDENGFIEDPVGSSPLDPGGEGHRGIEAVTAFYDKMIGPNELRFCIRQTFACGNECANVGTITTKLPGGAVSRTELVAVYCVNESGKILSLRAFWEFGASAKSMF